LKKCNCSGAGRHFPELDLLLEKRDGEHGGLIGILQEVQDLYGYLPEDALKRVADRTEIAIAKIYGVATFYTQFRLQPAGKYLLLLCMGTACHVNGASNIADTVKERLGIGNGETTRDGVFTLNVVACLGCCSLAPVMMVRSRDGEEVYGNLTRETVIGLLDRMAAEEVSA